MVRFAALNSTLHNHLQNDPGDRHDFSGTEGQQAYFLLKYRLISDGLRLAVQTEYRHDVSMQLSGVRRRARLIPCGHPLRKASVSVWLRPGRRKRFRAPPAVDRGSYPPARRQLCRMGGSLQVAGATRRASGTVLHGLCRSQSRPGRHVPGASQLLTHLRPIPA